MGDVYKGFRCKTHEAIAVKRVKSCYENNLVIREKARQEASMAYRHSNLVEMLGFCEYAYNSGPCFLLSKFVRGENIDTYMARITDDKIRVQKVCNAIIQVLDALDYLHSKGVIHRDIKPSNIMVEEDSNVRLMDLGIARQNGGNKWSRYGFIGTPQYAAPEQILREDNEANTCIDATTDLYSLGITFYELLTGNNPMNCPTDSLTLAKQMKEPLPPNKIIPRCLMNVILKATEKEQSRRYMNAQDFKQAIIKATEIPNSRWENFKHWIWDNIWFLLSICFITVIVIMYYMYYMYYMLN